VIGIAAFIAACVAATFLALRAEMLKPGMSSWPDSPACVRWASFALSACLGAYAVAIVDGYPPSTGEAGLLVALAGYAFLLWLNLFRQVRATAEH
jgi:hypothetical protein